MQHSDIHWIRRQIEMALEGFEGLEQVASGSDGSSSDVAKAMVPIIMELDRASLQLDTYCKSLPAVKATEEQLQEMAEIYSKESKH